MPPDPSYHVLPITIERRLQWLKAIAVVALFYFTSHD